jgi:hypothetical protein
VRRDAQMGDAGEGGGGGIAGGHEHVGIGSGKQERIHSGEG